jgi:hypothetical protein
MSFEVQDIKQTNKMRANKIKLTGIPANENFTSWKENKKSTVSQGEWKQISVDNIMQITDHRRQWKQSVLG